MMEGDEYYEITHQQALARALSEAEAALQASGYGSQHNADCWPLCAFGGKDADLSLDGCTGIKAIERVEETMEGYLLHVAIGGHKTIGDPTDACERKLTVDERQRWQETAREYVCGIAWSAGANIEWTGEEWVASWEDTITVPYAFQDGETPAQLAENIIQAAKTALAPWRREMASGDRMLDDLLAEMEGRRPSDADENDEQDI